MAQKVLILGDSGTGKSASLRNFKPEEVLIINSAGKPLPFKNHLESVTPAFNKLTSDVLRAMDATSKKVIIIDDAQYIMSFQYMRRIKENGWDKWNDIQGDFFNIIQHCDDLPADTIVYFLSHIQRDDEGHEKLKTMGKMLDEKITLEGLFTVVLKTSVKDGEYCFITQNSGMDTVKSPIGMFDSYAIDNDLKYVDTKIRNYYEIGDFADEETIQKMDQEVKKEAITKENPSGRSRRRKTNAESSEATDNAGSGTDDGQGNVSTSEQSTGQADSGSGTAEESKEPVKRRTRKDRSAESTEAPSEEKKEAPAAEEPRRRRRQRTDEVKESPKLPDFMNDEEDGLPFEV